ncbi:hypothetical protein [Streptomyces sp. URMC 129]|uniref:hypothetical protein n=1 Tax=Streptomyces sp. URMC 129 TaxID=3423407 RepID=UPI003F1BAAC8
MNTAREVAITAHRLTPAMVEALETAHRDGAATGRPSTLAALIRRDLLTPDATPTTAGRTVTNDLFGPTEEQRAAADEAAGVAYERIERGEPAAELLGLAEAYPEQQRQQLAHSRGANAYPLAVAAVRQVVREMPPAGALRVRVTEGSAEVTLTRDDLHALAYSGHTTADAVARVRAAVAAHIRHGEHEVHVMSLAAGMRPALYLADVMALLNRWESRPAEVRAAEPPTPAVPMIPRGDTTPPVHLADDDAERALCGAPVITGDHCRTSAPGTATCTLCRAMHHHRAQGGTLYRAGARVLCADGEVRTVTHMLFRTGEPARVLMEGGGEWLADNCSPAPAPAAAEAGAAARAAAADDIAHASAAAELADTVNAVTEAEAADGTWRGGWIAGTPTPGDGLALFDMDPDSEQGALFA